MRDDVEALCALGPRNFASYDGMVKAVALLEAKFKEAGLYPYRVDYKAKAPCSLTVDGVERDCEDQEYSNVVAEVRGTELPEEIVVFGAHYDSAAFPAADCSEPLTGSVGADDNASGVAATLALAREFAKKPGRRTLRFIAFANEEIPFGLTGAMGSRVCALRSAAAKERIVAMITPECIGFYSGKPGSQSYPFPMKGKPDRGDYIAFVSNTDSTQLVKDCVLLFRQSCQFPSDGACVPFGEGDRSDHWGYCKEGYPGLMATDTANLRNPNYHMASDTPASLDYRRMALVVDGLGKVVRALSDRK